MCRVASFGASAETVGYWRSCYCCEAPDECVMCCYSIGKKHGVAERLGGVGSRMEGSGAATDPASGSGQHLVNPPL